MTKHLEIRKQCLRLVSNFIILVKIKIKLSHFIIVVLLLTKEFVED